MKILYTILVFSDTLFLIFLSYSLLKFIDQGKHTPVLFMLIIGILSGIILLVYFVYNYLKIPDNRSLK